MWSCYLGQGILWTERILSARAVGEWYRVAILLYADCRSVLRNGHDLLYGWRSRCLFLRDNLCDALARGSTVLSEGLYRHLVRGRRIRCRRSGRQFLLGHSDVVGRRIRSGGVGSETFRGFLVHSFQGYSSTRHILSAGDLRREIGRYPFLRGRQLSQVLFRGSELPHTLRVLRNGRAESDLILAREGEAGRNDAEVNSSANGRHLNFR